MEQKLAASPQPSSAERRAPPTLRRHRPLSPLPPAPSLKLVRDGPCACPAEIVESRRAGLRLSPEDYTGLALESSRPSSSRSRPHSYRPGQPFAGAPAPSGRHMRRVSPSSWPPPPHPATHEISVYPVSTERFLTTFHHSETQFSSKQFSDSFLPLWSPLELGLLGRPTPYGGHPLVRRAFLWDFLLSRPMRHLFSPTHQPALGLPSRLEWLDRLPILHWMLWTGNLNLYPFLPCLHIVGFLYPVST